MRSRALARLAAASGSSAPAPSFASGSSSSHASPAARSSRGSFRAILGDGGRFQSLGGLGKSGAASRVVSFACDDGTYDVSRWDGWVAGRGRRHIAVARGRLSHSTLAPPGAHVRGHPAPAR